ncbi:hypothetical protein HMPREF1109_1057 [Streptococcus intermedius SK54 = ATCC 27335]|nr:hypothetical protein HMPREF1109_1057 [Streptococcus intermedius SK54 = ATCC 27335]
MFCNCLISSAIKTFSSIFFIFLFSSLSVFEQRKTSKPFLIHCFLEF